MKEFNVLQSEQSGFRSRYSTTTTASVCEAPVNYQYCAALFINLPKVFDSWHFTSRMILRWSGLAVPQMVS